MKKQISEILDGNLYLEGNIDEVIELLQKYKTDNSKYDTLELESRSNPYGEGYSIYLLGYRKETDKEEQVRLAIESKRKKENEKYELDQLTRLKKKYEGYQY
jgi:hypothetical protein